MADIRIKDLPPEVAPSASEKLALDGSSTRSATITAVVEAGRPAASQAEAEAGTQPTKAMTPLTTAQAIAFLGASAAQGALADSAVQPEDLAQVATSGDYDDLLNQPSLSADLIYPVKADAEAATVPAAEHALKLNGDVTEGDGLGGLYIDSDNGSADTFVSGDGRTWYLASDVGTGRLVDSAVETAKLADGAATNAKLADMATETIKGRTTAGTGDPEDLTPIQARDLLDPLRLFNANGSTDDSANFTALEVAVTGQEIDGRGKRYRITGAIPSGNTYVNGFWVKPSFEGGLTADIPFDFSTLPFTKTTIDASPGHNSWPENNFDYSEGERVGSFTASAHGSGGRFIGKSISGSLDHWRKAVPDFGRDQNDAANGFYNNGGMVFGGAEFQLKRRQAAGGGQPTDHRIYARNRQRRREVTNVITPRDTLTSFRVFKADVDFEVLEGTRATIIAAATVGGQTINGEYLCLANNASFMEFSAVGGAFVGTVKGGGFTQFIITESQFAERTFAAGASFGEQLVVNGGDDGLLVTQPAVSIGLAAIPSDLAGGAYTTCGGPGIYIVKMSGLFAGNNECTLSFVKKIASWATYGEPCLGVSKVDENMVVVGLRSDSSGQPPAFAVTLNGFTTISAPIPLSTTGNWGLDNNIPVASFIAADGEEHFFLALTGNRGGTGDISGWANVPVYFAHATRTELIAAATSGVSPFKVYQRGFVSFVDMLDDTGGSGRSGVGVGSLMALPNGVLNYVCGDMQRYSEDGAPRCHIVSFLFDVTRFLGLPPANVTEDADCASDTLVCWQGVSGSVISPSSDYIPLNYVVETIEDGMSTAGIFTPKETGWYECLVTAQLNGNALDQTIVCFDVATGLELVQPAFSGDLNSSINLIRANLPVGTNMTVMGFGMYYLLGGQSVKLRTGANTTIQITAAGNFIRWKRVA